MWTSYRSKRSDLLLIILQTIFFLWKSTQKNVWTLCSVESHQPISMSPLSRRLSGQSTRYPSVVSWNAFHWEKQGVTIFNPSSASITVRCCFILLFYTHTHTDTHLLFFTVDYHQICIFFKTVFPTFLPGFLGRR